jgi:hypothetical protein
MPDWTDDYNGLMKKLQVEKEAEESKPFVCQYPSPHFYPGLAESEIQATLCKSNGLYILTNAVLASKLQHLADALNRRKTNSTGPR